jgi:hypothetical protein
MVLKDGRYVGMLVQGNSDTHNNFVPIRRIRAWAKRVGIQFLLDPSLPVPSETEMAKSPVEESGTVPQAGHGGIVTEPKK